MEVVGKEDVGFEGLEEVEGEFGGVLVGVLVGVRRGAGCGVLRWYWDGVGGVWEFEEVDGSGGFVEDI